MAKRWVESIKLIENYQDRILLVRYEDFVIDPQLVLENLGQELGIDPAVFSMMDVHTDSIGKYLLELSEDEIRIIETIVGPTLERMGYRI